MKIGPQLSLVRNWEKPVSQPDSSQVHKDTSSSLHQTEGGHQLCSTCKWTAEFCLHHAQDRRDECTCVTDTNPEHCIDEEDSPKGWTIYARYIETFLNHVAPGIEEASGNHNSQNCKYNPELP